MLIAQISDTHLLTRPEPSKEENPVERRISDLRRTIAHINALARQPDIVLHTGDVVHNGRPDEYELALDLLGSLKAPLFSIIGNKDKRASFTDAFGAAGYLEPGSDFIQYSMDYGDLRLIALDSKAVDSSFGDFCPQRAEWLERRLAGVGSGQPGGPRFAIIFIHHPTLPATSRKPELQFVSKQNADRFNQIMAANRDKVLRVLCGHIHRLDQLCAGGVPLTTMTSIAGGLRVGVNRFAPAIKNTVIYQLHDFSALGQFGSKCMGVTKTIAPDYPPHGATEEGQLAIAV